MQSIGARRSSSNENELECATEANASRKNASSRALTKRRRACETAVAALSLRRNRGKKSWKSPENPYEFSHIREPFVPHWRHGKNVGAVDGAEDGANNGDEGAGDCADNDANDGTDDGKSDVVPATIASPTIEKARTDMTEFILNAAISVNVETI